jgi:hypothetical protein
MLTPNLKSTYLTYNLNDDEFLEACLLSPVQRAYIQNLRMETIEQKLTLTATLTPEGKEAYWQEEAFLRGQLSILDTLLAGADAARDALLEQDSNDNDNNPI